MGHLSVSSPRRARATVLPVSLTDTSESLFLLALVTIPFDNLWFAPSWGWATISPIILAGSAVCGLLGTKRLPKSFLYIGMAMVALLALSATNYPLFPPHLEILADRITTLSLGLLVLLSFMQYYLPPTSDRRIVLRRFRTSVVYLVIGYFLALMYGAGFVTVHELDFAPGVEFFKNISKRYYGERYALSFTEPSFASMHVWGVLAPFLLMALRLRDSVSVKRIVALAVPLVIFLMIFLDSARFAVDGLVLVAFLGIHAILKRPKLLLYTIIAVVIAVSVGSWLLSQPSIYKPLLGQRTSRIVETVMKNPGSAIYADASLASRFFRMDAIFSGTAADLRTFFFGFGFSNSSYALAAGYDAALMRYQNPFTGEVERLANGPVASYFSLPLELLASFGLIGLLLITIALYLLLPPVMFFLVIYLYLQFDSYAFYTLWLVIAFAFLVRRERRVNQNQSRFNDAQS